MRRLSVRARAYVRASEPVRGRGGGEGEGKREREREGARGSGGVRLGEMGTRRERIRRRREGGRGWLCEKAGNRNIWAARNHR